MPASANNDDIEAQIKALETEVAKIEPLKDQIERLRFQQLELKKEATAAAAALPTFQYRPARGLTITAADKSWSVNASLRVDMFTYFYPDSKTVIDADTGTNEDFRRTRRNSGALQPRRNRFYWTMCWADCFYEIRWTLDGERRPRVAQARDLSVTFHFEQFNPYLPSFVIGPRVGNAIYLGRSSSSDVKTEHNWGCDSISTTCTGSSSSMGLQWEDVPVGPGELAYHAMFHTRGVGVTHDEERDTTRKGFSTWLHYQPFSKMKNKWLQGLELAFGFHTHSIDKRANLIGDNLVDGVGDDSEEPSEMEVVTHEDRGDVTLISASPIGSGPLQFFSPGLKWRIGPYQFRGIWSKADFRDKGARRTFGGAAGGTGVEGYKGVGLTGWEIAHQIFLWSPKGFLTGSYTTPGSIHFGWAFERVDAHCARTLAIMGSADCSPGSGNFNSNHALNRELGIFYAIRPGMRMGYSWNWWKSDNTPVRTQVAIGCKKDIESAIAGDGAGRGCSWHTHTLMFQTRW
jgi:hypothetical protein